jgi:hypothetical protein
LILPPVDPEIGGPTLRRHLDSYWANKGLDGKGWQRRDLDDLHVVVTIPAIRADGQADDYHWRLGAEYYDAYPPTVLLVTDQEGWPRARAGTTWWPSFATRPDWFQIHDSSDFRDGSGQVFAKGQQLVCCSVTAEYYMSDHNPTEAQKWVPGKRTVAATLSRLAEVLRPPYYGGPSAPRNP